MPFALASKMARFTPGVRPRSSALMMRRRTTQYIVPSHDQAIGDRKAMTIDDFHIDDWTAQGGIAPLFSMHGGTLARSRDFFRRF